MADMLWIAICDDEPLFAQEAREYCGRILDGCTMRYTIDTYTCAQALLDAPRGYDLIFLDIDMPVLDGFDACAGLQAKQPHTKIVFLTSHEEYARKAFRYSAHRYLAKPCDMEEMREALCSAVDALAAGKLSVRGSNGAVHYLSIGDIVFLESLGDGAALHLGGETIVQPLSLKHWGAQYDEWLVRTHKSYLVNLAHVVTLTDRQALLSNGGAVPVSVRSRATVKRRLQAYIRAHAACVGRNGS